MENVVHLDENEWLSRAEMADKLDVSERTVTRRAKQGKLVRKENPNGRGNLYRRPTPDADPGESDARHETEGDETRQSTGLYQEDSAKEDTRRDTGQEATRDTTVSRLIERLEAKNERIAQLESEKGRLSAGLETAADYVEELEDRLERERERANELQQRLERVRDERDEARQEREAARFEIESLSDTIERLEADERKRTSLLRLGPLELLWRGD